MRKGAEIHANDKVKTVRDIRGIRDTKTQLTFNAFDTEVWMFCQKGIIIIIIIYITYFIIVFIIIYLL